MRSRSSFLAIAAAAMAAACSLVTNLDGLVTDATDGGDGGDAPVDVVLVPDGAAPDVGGDVEAGKPFCDGTHQFCADFDEAPLLVGWSSHEADAKGTIELSSAKYVSPGASFHATLARRAAGDTEYAVLNKDLPGPWKRTVVDFDFLLEAPAFLGTDINGAFVAIAFQSDDSAKTQFFYLVFGENYSNLGTPGLTIGLSDTPYDTFFHVHLDITAGVAVAATINGHPYQGTPPAVTAGANPRATVQLGITGFNAPVPLFSAFYDNCVIDQY